MALLLFIVSRSEPSRFTYLKHVFANETVDVMLDRRVEERRRRPGPVRGSAGPDPALAPLAPPGLRRSRRAGLGISLVRFEALSGFSGDPLSIDFYQDVDAYSLGRRS